MGNLQSQHSGVIFEERSNQDLSRLKQKLAREHALFAAAVEKNLAGLGPLLSVAGNAHRRDALQGFSVLHICCLLGWVEGLEQALEAGADINLASNAGYTPLMLACYSSSPACCQLLLDRGARPDLRSVRGSTAMHFAAQSRSKDALEQLLAHPSSRAADVDSPGYRSRTPLHLAVLTHGEPSIINLLLGRGANAGIQNSVLHGVTPLHTACHHGRVEALRALLEAHADPNVLSDDGLSPLLEVFAHPGLRHSEASMREMFSLLAAAGADLNVVLPRQGYTLLHFSMTTVVEEATVQLLLESGVDPRVNVNRPLSLFDPRSKSTMLHRACKKGWANVTRSLVAAGADMSLGDRDCLTPLHVAVIYKRSECVEALLRAGADPLCRAPDVFPSFALWKTNRGMQAIQAIMDLQADGNNVLAQLEDPELVMTAVDLAACVPQWIPTVEVFREHGVLPSEEALSRAVDTPIMRAVVERRNWTPELHAQLPDRFKAAARLLLLCLHRATAAAGVELPQQIVEVILTKAAWPVSGWADSEWLARQRVKQPAPVLPAPALFGGAAGLAAEGEAAAGGAPPPVFGGPHPQAFVGMMHQVFEQMQQGINEALAGLPGHDDEENEEEEDDEEEQEGGEGQAHGADAPPEHAGPGHPLLGGLFGGLGVPQMVGGQPFGPNMQVIQFEFNLPLFDGPLPGGLPQPLFGPPAVGGPPGGPLLGGPFIFPPGIFQFGMPGGGPEAEFEGEMIVEDEEGEGMEDEEAGVPALPEAAAAGVPALPEAVAAGVPGQPEAAAAAAAVPGPVLNQPAAAAQQGQEQAGQAQQQQQHSGGAGPSNARRRRRDEEMPPLGSDDECAEPLELRYNLRSRNKRQKQS